MRDPWYVQGVYVAPTAANFSLAFSRRMVEFIEIMAVQLSDSVQARCDASDTIS